MTSRSIVLSTAALLLFTAAAPLQIGLSPTPVHAQELSNDVKAALSGEPAGLEPKQLNQHIVVLRDAIEQGMFSRSERKAVQQKIKAYREVLKGHIAARQQANEQVGQGDKAQRGQDRKAERQAEKAERRAERQAEKAERQAEKAQRKAERQGEKAERRAERQTEAQQPAEQARSIDALGPDVIAALRDGRPASDVAQPELRHRVEMLGAAMDSGVLTPDQRDQVQARIRADREVVQARWEANQQAKAERESEQPPQRAAAEEIPQAEVGRRARDIIADDTPAGDLDDGALRKRLTENRAILGTGKLSRAEERHLRQQLRQDRVELRDRVASRQEAAEEPSSRSESKPRSRAETNPDAAIDQRTSADQLSDRDLERRVRALNRALKEERLARRDAEIARDMVERDRRELRRRLHGERDRRRERRREARSRNELVIDFNIGRDVGYRAPPVIFAAEAMPRDIEMQLVAPPVRETSRTYSVAEISRNHEVREMMPGIEVDTLNFDFGSAEVRPEEIDKLDDIAYVIEGIVAQRPDEVFLIEGHTDAVGSDAANDALSQRRAYAVMEALLDYYAIEPENLQTVGLGERFLKIWTAEPEEENRRVTIRRITPLLTGARG